MRLICLLLILTLSKGMAQELKIMTYNIRYDNPGDGENRWDNRKAFLASQWLFHEPDIVGIQEGLLHQLEFLSGELEDYAFIGVGRDDGKTKGEYSAVFYNKSKLTVKEQGTFWLSETPNEISVGWDASMERICTYGKFEGEGSTFWMFNTHFDHIGAEAREQSAQLIVNSIKELVPADEYVFITGDFNLEPTTNGINILKSSYADSFDVSKIKLGPIGTFNGFDHSVEATRRIDYVFVDSRVEVTKYGVLTDAVHLRYPSDHFPVLIEVVLK